MIRYRIGHPLAHRPRPKLCLVCKAEASYAEERKRPVAIIERDGRKHRTVETVRTYFCDLHTDIR